MYHHNIFRYAYLAIIITILFQIGSGCKSIHGHPISDKQARAIINRSIEYHGGTKQYDQLASFSFEKAFSLYKADGSVEYDKLQLHEYYPSKSTYHISWEQEKRSYKNSQYDTQYSQEINGEKNTLIDDLKIKSAIDASVFTIFLPWKLLDTGINLKYEGVTTLEDGKEVYTVKAIYTPEQHNNHTSTDIWWHYFDKESYRHEGYKVVLSDHASIISNLDFQTVDGLTFPKTRKSWRVNESNKKEYLRAAYDYKHIKISF